MKLNVLMVCYYFPPLADVGCKRSVAFARYFQKRGWTPFVLSVKNPDRGYCLVGNDLPPDGVTTEYSYSIINLWRLVGILNAALTKVLNWIGVKPRVKYLHLILCIPDIFWGWVPLTTIKGWKIVRKRSVDVIYVSCTPMSAAFCGVFLKLLTGKPLVLDFRDPYAIETVFERLHIPAFRATIDRALQNFFLKHTDIFIVNNEETKQIYLSEYPSVRNKIYAVHNGFEESFLPKGTPPSKYEKFTIIYTGEFYWYAIKSEIFFAGLSILKQQGVIRSDNFEFVFLGEGKELIEQLADKHGVADCVTARGRVPYSTVLGMIQRSHLQLLRIVKPMISTKLFEGIPLNIPFLATIPQGEVEEIIRRYSPSSYIVTEELPGEVAAAIKDAIIKYSHGKIVSNDVEGFLKGFARQNLALKLMSIIESAAPLRGRA